MRWLTLAVMVGTFSGGLPAGPLPVGPSMVTVDVGLPLEVFIHKPAHYDGGPLLVVFHGVNRNAEDYRNFATAMAERFGAIVAAPSFDKERFSNDAFQRGGIVAEGRAQPREKWTYLLLPKLVNALRQQEGRPELPYYFVGHSAGGQFVVRMVATVGTLGAVRVIAANPGSHLFPDREMEFGYGFGGLPEELADDAAIRRYVEAPLTIYLGTGDNDPNHPSLDRSAEALKQGATRYGRGLACFEAARSLALARGWRFGWTKVETPGIAHDAARMFGAAEAAEALFGAEKEKGRQE